MSNTSKIPAYVLEAKQKGEKFVDVIRRHINTRTGEITDEPFKVKTSLAIKVFQKEYSKLTVHERKILPVGSAKPSTIPVNAKEVASQLSADELRILLAEKEAAQTTTEEKPKRGRPKAQVSDTDTLDSPDLKEVSETQNDEA